MSRVLSNMLALAKSRSRRTFAAGILILLVLGIVKFWFAFSIASQFNDYVSDEVWYVSSARNIMNDVFGVKTKYLVEGMESYTVFVTEPSKIDIIREFVVERGGVVLRDNYEHVNAIAVAVNASQRVLERLPGVVKVIPGFPQPDEANIHKYYNLEHPPLGKYLIGLAMVLAGDKPVSWRLPGLIEAGLLVLLAGLVGWRLLGFMGMLVAGAAMALDPLTTRMGAIAMLDIHLAFFTALSILLAVYRRFTPSIISACLALMVKYSGILCFIPLYVTYRVRGKNPLRILLTSAALLIIVSGFVFAPLASFFGVDRLIEEFFGALKWHTTSRPAGPVSSNPLDWVLGINSFMLHVNPDIPARGSPFIYVPSFIIALLLTPLAFSDRKLRAWEREACLLGSWVLSLVLGYFIVMMLGNRTLYSFYATQASPALCSFLPIALYAMLLDDKLLDESSSYIICSLRDIVLGKIRRQRIPRELGFIQTLVHSPRSLQIYYLAAASASLMTMLLHLNLGQQWKLYCDAQWVTSAWALHEDPARAMGLTGVIMLVFPEFRIDGNTLVILDSIFLFLALRELALLAAKWGMQRTLTLATAMLSLVLYGAYDGSSMSVFLLLLGLNTYLSAQSTGKRLAGLLLIALSFNNVFEAIAVILAISTVSIGDSLMLTLFTASFYAPIFLYAGAESLEATPLAFMLEPKGPGFLALALGKLTPALLVLLALPAMMAVKLRKIRCGLHFSLPAIMLLCFAIAPNMLPQWCLPAIMLLAMTARRMPILTWEIDVANALIILLWFVNTPVMQALFKYTPSGPLDPLSLPALAGYARSLLLAIAACRLYLSCSSYRKNEVKVKST